MAHLSSCYFCGSALETPVETYELVGRESTDDQTTVTLCSSCKEKLAVVLDAADLGTVRTASADQTARRDTSPSETDTGAWAVAEEPSENDEADTAFERTETADSDEADEQTGVDDELSVDDTLDIEDDGFQIGEGEGAGDNEFEIGDRDEFETNGRMEDDQLLPDDDPLDDGTGTTSVGDEPSDDEVASASGSPDGAPEDDPITHEAREDDEPTPADEAQSVEEDGQSTPVDEGQPAEKTQSKTTISALEYNRVMRMLQNREFPVERNEIEVVAANAYDLERSECAQVIDLAVDRGLLDERDGELYRPAD